MAKQANITIRLDSSLKHQAEEAAQYLDQTLSQVIRFTLRRLIIEANSQKKRYENYPHINPYELPRVDNTKLPPLYQENGLGGGIKEATFESFNPARRLRELIDKEKKGFLTKQEREQKKSLLKANVDINKN